MSAYVIANARIFDGTGREPFAGEVVVEGNRIASVTAAGPGELGVVAPGALADLLLVDGDPLTDIEMPQGRNAIRMIMKGGTLHKVPPAPGA